MKRIATIVLSCIVVLASGGYAGAQVAGSSAVGVTVEELKEVALGWSAKKQILGQGVYNEKNEKVGVIDDLVIAPDRAVSYAIVGAGGFVGLAKHDVAIPIGQVKQQDGKFVIPGATKEAIKALPKFEYAKKK
jgi:sporulation protein YlmC with PRC-barrel domain